MQVSACFEAMKFASSSHSQMLPRTFPMPTTWIAVSLLLVLLMSINEIAITDKVNSQHATNEALKSSTVAASAATTSSSLDEEIILDSSLVDRHDYNGHAVVQSIGHDATKSIPASTTSVQPNHDHNHKQNSLNSLFRGQLTAVQTFDRVDPFAATFSDFLADAKRTSLHHHGSDTESYVADMSGDSQGFIIEDGDSVKDSSSDPKSESLPGPQVDFIFPAREEHHHHHQQQQHGSEHKKHNLENAQLHQGKLHDPKTSSEVASEVLNEIKLLFAWKQLPTNKCSKTCGRGFRINHISCVDLKYDVRVENELCLKSNKAKPDEVSDEPCNEIDCQPEWTSIDNEDECNRLVHNNCQTNGHYKRVICAMIDKYGQSVHLPDSKCQYASGKYELESRILGPHHEIKKNLAQTISADDESVEINFDDTAAANQMNDILPNLNLEQYNFHSSKEANSVHPHNEPFYDPGPWSECSGGQCGQLGKRHRKLTCRLFLSRSSRLVELPDSSCQSAVAPDTEEPCYLDCPPDSSYSIEKPVVELGIGNRSNENDETVYDVEMTRFVWRNESWTRCSSECLGGRRESIVECWDKMTETAVELSLCDQDLKPNSQVEACNEGPCEPDWRIEPFSSCTRYCGSNGVQTRLVSCVQQTSSSEGTRLMIVPNEVCLQAKGSMPHRIEPCNRVNCKPEWQVGPWTCLTSSKCGAGTRTRNVTCQQEFATRDGMEPGLDKQRALSTMNDNLKEAIAESAKTWYPGKVTEVPLDVCYEEYKMIPEKNEPCFLECDNELYIDADSSQNFTMDRDSFKRKTVTLKVGGQARINEGRNLKIRCKVRRRGTNFDRKASIPIEWNLDGVKIFANGTSIADKHYHTDESIPMSNDVIDEYVADEPSRRTDDKQINSRTYSQHQQKRRTLTIRSWSQNEPSFDAGESQLGFSFVPSMGGRFTLGKENALKITRLRPEDSGRYTCSYGSMSETLTLQVVNSKSSDHSHSHRLRGLDDLKQL